MLWSHKFVTQNPLVLDADLIKGVICEKGQELAIVHRLSTCKLGMVIYSSAHLFMCPPSSPA